MARLSNWIGHDFCRANKADDAAFLRDAKADLKEAAKEAECTLYRFYPNHYGFTAVLKARGKEKYIFVRMSNLRKCSEQSDWYRKVSCRQMRYDTDWVGGEPYLCSWSELSDVVGCLLHYPMLREQKPDSMPFIMSLLTVS